MFLLKAALNYVKNDIPVFPVHGINDPKKFTCEMPNYPYRGKHPIQRDGDKKFSFDQSRIVDFWDAFPGANIGVPTGLVSGWYVIEIDHKEESIANYIGFAQENNIPPPSVQIDIGGGGYHLIYGVPADGKPVCSNDNIEQLPGVKIRADDGYIIVPPSQHDSGYHYDWTAASPFFTVSKEHNLAHNWLYVGLHNLVPLPAIIADLANAKSSQLIVNQGGRKGYLFKKACEFCKYGNVTWNRKRSVAARLLDYLHTENQSVCNPPLDFHEIKKIEEYVIDFYEYNPSHPMRLLSKPTR